MTPTEKLVTLLESGSAPLAESMLLLSAALTDREDAVDVGLGHLAELARGVDEPTTTAVTRHLFDALHFRGDIDDYHSPENSFLDRVLERRIGMPITLSAVVVDVGQRIGLGLHLVGMPGHVLVGLDDTPDSFIDAFGGVVLDAEGVQQRFASIFGAEANLTPQAMQPIDTAGVISRVCNNLTRSWIERDARALNTLLDLRAALPASSRDRQILIGIAEGRGRFDLAARLRTELDPDDPAIDGLWAQLN